MFLVRLLANDSSLIIDRPIFLVDLNQIEIMSPLPEYQANINHVNILSDHVDPDTSTLNKSISKVDRLQFLHASISKRVRNMLNNLPTNVYHYEEIDKLFFTLEEKINKKFVSVMSPSKIMTKRQHNFFIP
jgi:hypothetical protein